MAVGSTTALARTARTRSPGRTDRVEPVRTCIGCRKRAGVTELLRVVVAYGSHGEQTNGPAGSSSRGPEILPVVPDPRRRAAGRGAWLHLDPDCVALAERRRAFDRALRVPGHVDPTPVREYVVACSTTPTSGTPQELKNDGSPMNRLQ